jgi:hypothetical protein
VKDIPIDVKNVPNDVFNSYVFKYENRQKSEKQPYEHQQRQSPEVGEGKNLKFGWNVGRKVPDGTDSKGQHVVSSRKERSRSHVF